MTATYAWLELQSDGTESGDSEGWLVIQANPIPAGAKVQRVIGWGSAAGEGSSQDVNPLLRVPAWMMSFNLVKQVGVTSDVLWAGAYPCHTSMAIAVRPNDAGTDQWEGRVNWTAPPVHFDMSARFSTDPSGIPETALGVIIGMRPIPLQDPDNYRYNSTWYWKWYLKILLTNYTPPE